MPTGYDNPKVYDDKKTDGDRHPGQTAADDQKQAGLRDMEEHFKKPSISDEVRQANLKKKETEPGGLYSNDQDKPSEKFLQRVKSKIKNMSGRKKAAMGIGAGGIGGLLIFASLIGSTYRIPSLMGGLDDNVNSSRMVRLIVERRFERMLVEWQIRKKAGTLDQYVRPGSAMDKLYKAFEVIKLEKTIEQGTGLKWAKAPDGHVHVYFKGKDMGRASSWNEYKAVKKKHKAVAKASKRMVTHTVPIARFSFSTTIRNYITKQFAKRFVAPKWDKEKSREENLKTMRADQLEPVSKGAVSQLRSAFACIFGNDCTPYENSNQPVDTKDPTPKDFTGGGVPDDRSAQIVTDEVDKAAEAAAQKSIADGSSWAANIVEELTKGFISASTAKTISSAIPIVGQINALAVLDHIGWEINDNNLADRVPVALKEQVYGGITATWKGYADNMKLGKMDIAQVNELNAQIAGAGGALAYHYLFKGISNVGEPVDPPVGSNKQRPLRAAQDFAYKKTPFRVGHEVLNQWYENITPIFNAIEDFFIEAFGSVLGWALRISGIAAALESSMTAIFGENWQAEFGKWAATTILDIFGATIDPLARGAKLFNYLYVGTDVIMNKYCQTNLGCQALTTLSDKGFFEFTMLQEDRQLYQSTLSWNDRLFSLDEPGSLTNAAIRELPTSPGGTISAVATQISLLPARLLGIVSGKAFAAETPLQDVSIDEVRQFGFPTDESLDYDIPVEVREDADPKCPPNDDNRLNECQTDKEINEIAMCVATDCPQLQDPSDTLVAASGPTSGPVSADGNIRELAKQLLDLRGSGQIKMNPEVVQDLERTRDGNAIATCGVKDLDPALLNLLIRIGQRYKYTLWNIVTGHECNFGEFRFHPKGQAADIGAVNGEPANLGGRFRPLMNATLAREFALYVAGSMPTGRGGMGQSDCTVLIPVNNWPPGVQMFDGDSCNHFHVDVGDYKR